MTSRGLAPVVGVVLLVGVTLLLAAAIVALVSIGPTTGDLPQATIDGTIEIGDQTNIMLEHRGGDALAVDRLDLHIEVDGEPLRHQPPLPHWNPKGFKGFPSGPFNAESSADWSPGERATLRLDEDTNAPVPGPDSTVTVTVLVDGHPISERELRHAS